MQTLLSHAKANIMPDRGRANGSGRANRRINFITTDIYCLSFFLLLQTGFASTILITAQAQIVSTPTLSSTQDPRRPLLSHIMFGRHLSDYSSYLQAGDNSHEFVD